LPVSDYKEFMIETKKYMYSITNIKRPPAELSFDYCHTVITSEKICSTFGKL